MAPIPTASSREAALTHIENAISMIFLDMASVWVLPSPDEPVPGGSMLTIEAG